MCALGYWTVVGLIHFNSGIGHPQMIQDFLEVFSPSTGPPTNYVKYFDATVCSIDLPKALFASVLLPYATLWPYHWCTDRINNIFFLEAFRGRLPTLTLPGLFGLVEGSLVHPGRLSGLLMTILQSHLFWKWTGAHCGIRFSTICQYNVLFAGISIKVCCCGSWF